MHFWNYVIRLQICKLKTWQKDLTPGHQYREKLLTLLTLFSAGHVFLLLFVQFTTKINKWQEYSSFVCSYRQMYFIRFAYELRQFTKCFSTEPQTFFYALYIYIQDYIYKHGIAFAKTAVLSFYVLYSKLQHLMVQNKHNLKYAMVQFQQY